MSLLSEVSANLRGKPLGASFLRGKGVAAGGGGGGGGGSPYPSAVLEDNPLGYWRLGESEGPVAVDETGNHPGTYQDNPVLGVEGAISGDDDTGFNANATGWVEVPDDPAWGISSITIEAWVSVQVRGRSTFLFHRGQSSSYNWGLYESSSGIIFYIRAGGNVSTLDIPAALVPLDTWTHIVGTYDGSTMRAYADGVEVDSQSKSGSLSNNAGAVHLGGNWSGKIVSCKLDEMAIYDHALSPERVAAHFAEA